LLRGEALFSVKRDVLRPFRVTGGFALVEALGTDFDIFRRPARTTVSVIAGEVSVLSSKGNGAPADTDRRQYASSPGVPNSSRLIAGEQVSVGPDGRIGSIERPDISKILQWREGRLTFEEVPLEEVAEEFNRYNTVKIVVEGAALRARPVSGIYSSDHPETLIHELQSKDSNIAVTKTDDAFILRSK
jgi:transmembrane sensor